MGTHRMKNSMLYSIPSLPEKLHHLQFTGLVSHSQLLISWAIHNCKCRKKLKSPFYFTQEKAIKNITHPGDICYPCTYTRKNILHPLCEKRWCPCLGRLLLLLRISGFRALLSPTDSLFSFSSSSSEPASFQMQEGGCSTLGKLDRRARDPSLPLRC